MKGFLGLLSINLSGKLISVLLFAFLARVLDAEHLAYIGLIPALAGLMLVLLSFGVGTLLERDFPRIRMTDPAAADALMRTGMAIAAFSVVLMFLMSLSLLEYWPGVLLRGYSIADTSILWIALPVAGHMFLELVGWMLIIRGNATHYGVVKVYGDLCGKACALILYFWWPSALAVFLGLAIGNLPFLLSAIWGQRNWLFRGIKVSPVVVLRSSGVFYVESVFQMFRDRGDRLLVSSVLGPIAMASYYVARTVAAQLTVLYSPVSAVIIPSFSSRFGLGRAELEQAFGKVWSIAPPLFFWMASTVAALSPFLLEVIAGSEYTHAWQTALILCYATAVKGAYSIASRILLIVGSSVERFRVVIAHVGILAVLMLLVRDRFGSEGVALCWLSASVLVVIIVRIRAGLIGFKWPRSSALGRSLLLCVPVPLVSLYVVGYGTSPDWVPVVVASGLSALSLVGLLGMQNAFEAEQMSRVMPGKLVPYYRWLRSLAGHG